MKQAYGEEEEKKVAELYINVFVSDMIMCVAGLEY